MIAVIWSSLAQIVHFSFPNILLAMNQERNVFHSVYYSFNFVYSNYCWITIIKSLIILLVKSTCAIYSNIIKSNAKRGFMLYYSTFFIFHCILNQERELISIGVRARGLQSSKLSAKLCIFGKNSLVIWEKII